MKRNRMHDVTFLIPVRIDSIDRLENLLFVSEFILTNFETKIHIHEAAEFNNGILRNLLPKDVKITFAEDHDPIFHRTRIINNMIKEVNTPIVAVWDADVIVSKNQIHKSINALRNKLSDFVSPYSGRFLDTSKIIRSIYFENKEINFLDRNQKKMKALYGPVAFGGGFFANLKEYKETGLENEKFYGWGHEDGERINRWLNLGKRFIRIPGVMYHLSHSRSLNSGYQSPNQKEYKLNEIRRNATMTREELRKEVKSWSFVQSQ